MLNPQTNESFAQILLSNGFVETSSSTEKAKEKRTFKLHKNSKKKITIDLNGVKVINSKKIFDAGKELNKDYLKAMLLYFKLSSSDFKELNSNNNLDFEEVNEKFKITAREYLRLRATNSNLLRKVKLERIVQLYNTFKFD
ncbi:hypothetical protein [Tenacibaculum sp. IB213877]|uniref:hypothetical protein n=1 Tax=Tenacibaculum sp. IB213877 TaxID=3097351 RepID=UPI002A5A9CB7|nr:hypothetical protein [Tenacibaculum sp. IB213877]MDY0781151.1 hypothetical protein [Tenacibaculum sp. IB213877]